MFQDAIELEQQWKFSREKIFGWKILFCVEGIGNGVFICLILYIHPNIGKFNQLESG